MPLHLLITFPPVKMVWVVLKDCLARHAMLADLHSIRSGIIADAKYEDNSSIRSCQAVWYHSPNQPLVNSDSSSHTIPRRPVGAGSGQPSRTNLATVQTTAEPVSILGEGLGSSKDRNPFSKLKRKLPSRGGEQTKPAVYPQAASRPALADEPHAPVGTYENGSADTASGPPLPPRPTTSQDPRKHHGGDDHGPRPFGKLFGQSRPGADGQKEQPREHHREVSREGLKDAAKAGRGFFWAKKKQEPAIDPAKHVFKVVNLPLEEQTRATRVVKVIETPDDKLGFWLPAIALRCLELVAMFCSSLAPDRLHPSGTWEGRTLSGPRACSAFLEVLSKCVNGKCALTLV